MNNANYVSVKKLGEKLSSLLDEFERQYDCSSKYDDEGIRFENLIKTIYKKTGQKVVVLIDEYDKPLIETLNKPELYENFRMLLKSSIMIMIFTMLAKTFFACFALSNSCLIIYTVLTVVVSVIGSLAIAYILDTTRLSLFFCRGRILR